MRMDKFLKNSRLIKRRTVAKEACEKEKIRLNDKIAKPGDNVKVGDLITLELGSVKRRVEVLDISENVSKADAMSMYREKN
ncbi:MAG: RNA-binding S4 domain-containing protein [Tissierellia bacterium]|nr:RNA-binding S4 domain-containing protein [Tissierellia bacterium]